MLNKRLYLPSKNRDELNNRKSNKNL